MLQSATPLPTRDAFSPISSAPRRVHPQAFTTHPFQKTPPADTFSRSSASAALRFSGPLSHVSDTLTHLKMLPLCDPLDMDASYHHLSTRQQGEVDRWMGSISLEDIQRYQSQNRYGLLEECSDILYEYYILKAIQKNLLNQDNLTLQSQWVKQAIQSGMPFEEAFHKLQESISPDKVKAYQSLTHLDDPQAAADLMTLTSFKFMLGMIRGKTKNIRRETQLHIIKEGAELAERIPGLHPYKALMRLQTTVVSAFPNINLPGFPAIPQRLVRESLAPHGPQHQDYLRFLHTKHRNRNELDYNSPGLGYIDRKKLLKPFEVLMETVFLKELEARPQPE